jgi:hypothetical protein
MQTTNLKHMYAAYSTAEALAGRLGLRDTRPTLHDSLEEEMQTGVLPASSPKARCIGRGRCLAATQVRIADGKKQHKKQEVSLVTIGGRHE